MKHAKHARGSNNGPQGGSHGEPYRRSAGSNGYARSNDYARTRQAYGQYSAPNAPQSNFQSGPYKQYALSNEQVRGRAAQHRQKSTARKVGTVIGIIFLVLILGLVGFYLWFIFSLNSALDRNTDKNALDALTSVANGEPFYTLVLASDERVNEHDSSVFQYTDVMMLMRVDTKNNQVTMLSIPRDTPYTLEDGTVTKMNELFAQGGVKLAIKGVSDVTHLPISHYAMVYMSDCKAVVNELGGVEIDVPLEINNNDPETEENVNVQPGLQVLDGLHAQAFAISRKEFDGNQDAYRQEKIRTLLSAIMKKVLDRPVYEIPGEVIKLAKYVETDLRANDLIDLVLGFSDSGGDITIYQASGPSDGDIDEATGMWLCYPNPEGWAKVVSVMDSGGDPSTVEYT